MPVKTVKVTSTLDNTFRIESDVRGHKVVVDQPEAAGGANGGPTPLEYLFVSIAGCIGSMARIMAMQKRLPVRGMTISVEGDVNTDGLLGKATEDRIGFTALRVTANIDADMTLEEKQAFLAAVDSRCPVSENLEHGVPIAFDVVG